MLLRRHVLQALLAAVAGLGWVAFPGYAQDAGKKNVATTPESRPDKWWQDRHANMNKQASEGTAELVFIGDSITQGWEGGEAKKIWDENFGPMKPINLGISGDRTEHVLWRLANGNLGKLKPKVAVIMIGTNNTGHQSPGKYECSAAQTAEGITQIVKTLREKWPSTKILLLGVFPRGEKPDDKMRVQNAETNAIIQKLDDGKMVTYLDISKKFLQEDGALSKEIMPDLLHLNAKSYQIWADAITPKIKELGGW
jgi:lysophospholipase L1-like esterase